MKKTRQPISSHVLLQLNVHHWVISCVESFDRFPLISLQHVLNRFVFATVGHRISSAKSPLSRLLGAVRRLSSSCFRIIEQYSDLKTIMC
jgi:hypothetical protein